MPTYNFARGHPNKDLIPVSELKATMLQIGLSTSDDGEHDLLQQALNYGDEAGESRLLKELSSFLERQCARDRVSPSAANTASTPYRNELFITGGVSHGIELLCAAATQPGDIVWVEEPTYFLAANIFRSHGLIIEAIPMRQVGVIDTDALEARLLDASEKMHRLPRLIYVIPTHQNPTGATMTLRNRVRLAEMARTYRILIIADEVYHLLDYQQNSCDGLRPARMATLNKLDDDVDTQGLDDDNTSSASSRHQLFGCCSVSSFTKIFAPGVRLGWVEGPPRVIEALKQYGYIVSQGGIAPFMGHVFTLALQQRVCDNVLEKLCRAYSERANLLMSILAKDSRLLVPCPARGGYFLWLVLPFPAASFLEYCQPEISFMLGSRCSAMSHKSASDPGQYELDRSVRLCFAYMDMKDLKEGAELLVTMFNTFADEQVS
jgi:2-aminoadipate transaminase